MIDRKYIYIVFALLALVCFIGFGIDIMDIDAAQYASMSREMMASGHYLQLFDLGKDYLDKPPFLFWISSLSLKLFGITNFAYRLPSFLFAALAVFSTYKFSRLFYEKSTSILSAIILASCQGFILMNHDVRTDTILMSWVIFSIWQLAEWFQNKKLIHFIIGTAGIAFGMMTKGPIALIVPVFAFGSHILLQRKFSQIFKWQYILGGVVIAICLIPMSWGLYQQFDMQPEKLVNGGKNVSGLKFFYWTQSFGRITGESTWNNNSNIFFLLQNMLWSFLPWIILFLVASFVQIKEIIRQQFFLSENQEGITVGGFLLTYLSLGLSKFQLPHYIFVAFPFAAIITARFINDLLSGNKHSKIINPLLYFHFILFILLWLILITLLIWPFESISLLTSCIAIVVFIGFIILFFKIKNTPQSILVICLYTSIGLNLFLNAFFYPSLLNFQAGSTVGKWISKNNIPIQHTYTYQYPIWRSLHFYAKGIIGQKDSLNQISSGDYILTNEKNLQTIKEKGKLYTLLYSGYDYPVTRLSLTFINPKKRATVIEKFAFIKIK
jgi:4-amino-4-deoxy-L-arabinose transferase-like glycosyltransferase